MYTRGIQNTSESHTVRRSVFSSLAGTVAISLSLSLEVCLAASTLQYGGGAVPLLLTRNGWTAPSLGFNIAALLRLNLQNVKDDEGR